MEKRNDSLSVCSCSGGIDSTTTAIWQIDHGYDVQLIHFKYGQLSETREEISIRKIAKLLDVPINIVDVGWLGKLGGSPLTDATINLPKGFESVFGLGCWVSARNVVFLSYAAALAESLGGGVITLGGESSESHYLDNTQEFADRFSAMLELGCLKPVKVVMPLVDWTKIDELKWGYEKGYDEIYKYTWSCDKGLSLTCGICGCCNSRRFAYHKLEIEDPQKYLDDGYFYDTFLPEYENRKKEIEFKYE